MSNSSVLRCSFPNCSFEGPRKYLIHHQYKIHGIFIDLHPQASSIVDSSLAQLQPHSSHIHLSSTTTHEGLPFDATEPRLEPELTIADNMMSAEISAEMSTSNVLEHQLSALCIISSSLSPVDMQVDGADLLSAISNIRIKKSREERAGPRVRKKKPWCPYNPKRRHKKLPCPDCESHEASLRGLNIKAPEFVPSSHCAQSQPKR